VTMTVNTTSVPRIAWHTQFDYDHAVSLARKTNKPILLDLYSESDKGCRALNEHVWSNPLVIEKVSRATVPVRIYVDSEEANPITNAVVGSHIFIWSQTVQLISPDGDIYHKFLGAPRHTRLDLGYTRVHHDVVGHLPVEEFLAQLQLALGKESLARGDYELAVERLVVVGALGGLRSLAREEAAYWLPIAESHGVYPRQDARRVTKNKDALPRSVERLCEALKQIPDSELMLDWHGSPGPDDWEKYSDCLREVVFGVYQELIDAAHAVSDRRDRQGRPLTTAQRILKYHQIAYRELQGVTVGLSGEELDRVHLRENRSLGKQRTIRNNLVHCVMAEWWAHSPQIRGTLQAKRNGAAASVGTAEETMVRFGEPPNNFGNIEELIERSEDAHRALIDEFQNITDDELEARAQWWENRPISVRFRLNRLSWHLHDHRTVIETILERIGRKRTETERLVTLLYRALGEVEASLIGLPREEQDRLTAKVLQFVEGRALEIEHLADTFVSKESN
jgi:hypothetical protein